MRFDGGEEGGEINGVLALDRFSFELVAGDFDGAVERTQGIDHFCSSSAWILAAHAALAPSRELYCRRGEHGWVVLARHAYDAGWCSLEPLEAAWGLACPFAVEGEAIGLVIELAEDLRAGMREDVLFLSGIPHDSELEAALTDALEPRYRVDTTSVPRTRRFRAELRGGVDGFLGRRSRRFRERLRQAQRRAEERGVRFEAVVARGDADVSVLCDRVMGVEARSWKGREGAGLAVPEMERFYRLMLARLAGRGAVRAQVGSHEGRDVAVIFGALTESPEGKVYRGLQFSFDDDYRALSLGNLAQLAQIQALVDEGVSLDDLGSEVDYKKRWGELCLETVTLVAIPRTLPLRISAGAEAASS